MMSANRMLRRSIPALAAALVFVWAGSAQAHCDTLDGPVVSDARQALDTGNPNRMLAWVQPKDEARIRAAFEDARAVRQAGGAARELADNYFFETLVRVHRAGEGAPYTGLKPAGSVEKPIAAADESIASGNVEGVAKMIFGGVREGLHGKFDAVAAHKDRNPEDVAAGRAFVAAYVDYIHYVERLYDAVQTEGAAHGGPGAEPAAHAH